MQTGGLEKLSVFCKLCCVMRPVSKSYLWPLLQYRGVTFPRIGDHYVVVIYDPNVVSGHVLQARVHGTRLAFVLFLQVLDALAVGLKDLLCIVRRAVIDHDHLMGRQSLSKYTVQTVRNESRAIESRYQHRESWSVHCCVA